MRKLNSCIREMEFTEIANVAGGGNNDWCTCYCSDDKREGFGLVFWAKCLKPHDCETDCKTGRNLYGKKWLYYACYHVADGVC